MRASWVSLGLLGTSFGLAAACGHGPADAPSGSGGGSGGGCVGCGAGGSAGISTGGSGGGGSVLEPEVCAEPVTAASGAALGSAEAAGAEVEIRLNHLGYDVRGTKRVVIESSAPLTSFQLVASGAASAFFDGQLEDAGSFTAWGGLAHHYVADFSRVELAGDYVLRVNGEDSPEFAILEDLLLHETLPDVLGFFELSRANDSEIQSADTSVPLYGSAETDDVRGGWYDASGDLSKYLSHLSYANFLNPQQIPLTAWGLAYAHDAASGALSAAGLASAVQEEALYGADYLVRAQNSAGFFYLTVFDGWTGEPGDRDICAFVGSEGTKTDDYQAAFREGGGMSIAALARVASWGVSGEFSPAEYLSAAETGFSHLLTNGPGYCDDGQENVIDDMTALLAATELYAATNTASYLDAARTRATALSDRLHAEGYFVADDGSRPYWHASDAGLPIVALVRYAEVETDAAARERALTTVHTHLDYLVDVTHAVANPYGYARQHFETGGSVTSGFFIPHDNESGYWWQGESARQASLATALVLGARALGSQGCSFGVHSRYGSVATDQLDWILGKNPYDISMLSGHGRNNPPAYVSAKTTFHGHHDGGISNGITGRNTDGTGIQWMRDSTDPETEWENWRWVEQWLPHSTWYLIAVATLAAD